MTIPLPRCSALPLLLLAACDGRIPGVTVEGSGTAAVETRQVSGFHTVAFSIPGELTVERGAGGTLRMEGDDNLLPRIRTEVKDGVLTIGSDRATLRPSAPLRLHLSAGELRGVIAAGSGSVLVPGLRGEEVSVTVAGSGGVRAEGIEAERVRVEIAGSGRADLSGRAPQQVVTVAGSGDLHAGDLVGERVEVTVAGSGTARVHAREHLSSNLVGSGSVVYRGEPRLETRRVGSGSVQRAE